MNAEETFEVEELLSELEKYEYPFIKKKVERIKNVMKPIFDNERDKQFKKERNLKYSWNKCDPSNIAQRTLQNFSQAISFYEEAKCEMESYNKETQDILHALELTEIPDEELNELMVRLKNIRRYRRTAKDFVELMEPFYRYSLNNKHIVKDLGKIHGEVSKEKMKKDNRIYTPRVLTSMEEAFKQVSAAQG